VLLWRFDRQIKASTSPRAAPSPENALGQALTEAALSHDSGAPYRD